MPAPTRFEWNEAKSQATLASRGFDFERATRIFGGHVLEEPDTRRDYGEIRIRALGAVEDDVLAVVYTDRGDVRRIVSARPANRKERARWRSSAKL